MSKNGKLSLISQNKSIKANQLHIKANIFQITSNTTDTLPLENISAPNITLDMNDDAFIDKKFIVLNNHFNKLNLIGKDNDYFFAYATNVHTSSLKLNISTTHNCTITSPKIIQADNLFTLDDYLINYNELLNFHYKTSSQFNNNSKQISPTNNSKQKSPSNNSYFIYILTAFICFFLLITSFFLFFR